MNKINLNNGLEMPILGLGTYMIRPVDAEKSVEEALKMGYRLIDTANAYVNEKAVGRGIKNSGVKREDIFISSKLWITEYNNPNAIDNTLERLGIDYIDLLFLHQPGGDYLKGYKMIEDAYKKGKVKAIGISNFEGKYIEEILENCEIKPQVIQVEAHPYFHQDELRKILDRENIKLMSWYPLGHGDSNLLNEDVFKELGEKYHKTPAQIILRWHIEMGFIVIPGSKDVNHIKDNYEVLGFKLDESDMKKIDSINKNERYYTRTEEALTQFATFKPQYED